MTRREALALWAAVAPKCNWVWCSDLCWMKVQRRSIPVMHICGGNTPTDFGATKLWMLTRFGKRENRLQFRSSYLLVRLCYHDRTYTKREHLQSLVRCDDLHIVGDTPYRFGAIQLWNWLAIILKRCKCPPPSLPRIFFNIATVRLLLGPFWIKTMATWQSSGLSSVWITTFRPLHLEDWKVVEENLCTLFTAILLVSTCGIITCQRGCYMRVDHV